MNRLQCGSCHDTASVDQATGVVGPHTARNDYTGERDVCDGVGQPPQREGHTGTHHLDGEPCVGVHCTIEDQPAVMQAALAMNPTGDPSLAAFLQHIGQSPTGGPFWEGDEVMTPNGQGSILSEDNPDVYEVEWIDGDGDAHIDFFNGKDLTLLPTQHRVPSGAKGSGLDCDCCGQTRPALPYHHDAHDYPASWDYCQECFDAGCDLVTCSLPNGQPPSAEALWTALEAAMRQTAPTTTAQAPTPPPVRTRPQPKPQRPTQEQLISERLVEGLDEVLTKAKAAQVQQGVVGSVPAGATGYPALDTALVALQQMQEQLLEVGKAVMAQAEQLGGPRRVRAPSATATWCGPGRGGCTWRSSPTPTRSRRS